MRIFTASLGTETNTYAPIPTDRSAFESTFYAPPGKHPQHPTLCSAPIVVLRRRAHEEGFELVEGTAAFAEPGGLVSRQCYEGLRDEILSQLVEAMPVDGVVLGLHGAMIAQGYDDCEGDLLARIRGIVGPDVLVSSELDPHSHLTQKRFDAADILIAFKEFSHVDFVERAEELVQLSLRAIRGEIKPVMSKFDCKMIEVLPTSTEPMRGFMDRIMTMEAHSELSQMSKLTTHTPGPDPQILSISCIHGFMPADVEAMGSHILVVTDGAAHKGAELAQTLGMELFELRGSVSSHGRFFRCCRNSASDGSPHAMRLLFLQTRPDYLSVEAALDRAEDILADDHHTSAHTGDPRGPVVIADGTVIINASADVQMLS
jgi:microcystin degradation protein MlrC